jgi:hypothetical protein
MAALVNTDLINGFASAFEMGYRRCLRDRGALPKVYSQTDAESRFSGALILKWRRMGLIEPIKTGDSRNNKVLYDAERLELLYAATLQDNNKIKTRNIHK